MLVMRRAFWISFDIFVTYRDNSHSLTPSKVIGNEKEEEEEEEEEREEEEEEERKEGGKESDVLDQME